MTIDGRLREILLELGDTLVDFDLAEFSYRVCERCVELLDVEAAGIMLPDASGEMAYLASSSENSRLLEVHQAQRHEGPCQEAFTSAAVVVARDLRDETDRWPHFAPRALELGFDAAIALPMRTGAQVIGSLNLFTFEFEGEVDLDLAQALADITALGIRNADQMERAVERGDQLQHALDSRVLIEQAKGVLAERAGVHVDEAFLVMRRHARHTNKRIGRLAEEVVEGRISVEQLQQLV